MTPQNFEVVRRNPGHWDIYIHDVERVAKIRGDKNEFFLMTPSDSKIFNDQVMGFPSVESCMAYVCATLMKE